MSYNHAPINTFLLNHRGNRPFPSYPRLPGTQVKQGEPHSCSVIVNTHHILWWSTAHGKNEPGWGMAGFPKISMENIECVGGVGLGCSVWVVGWVGVCCCNECRVAQHQLVMVHHARGEGRRFQSHLRTERRHLIYSEKGRWGCGAQFKT